MVVDRLLLFRLIEAKYRIKNLKNCIFRQPQENCQEGEKAGSWHRTAEGDRHHGMPQNTGDGLVTTPSHVYSQSKCYCALCDNYHTINNNRNRVLLYYCFRKINHLVVKNHWHSSSGVREVVWSTEITVYKVEAAIPKI
jgi:hypothetical protein